MSMPIPLPGPPLSVTCSDRTAHPLVVAKARNALLAVMGSARKQDVIVQALLPLADGENERIQVTT
jgi:hypothetical protein